MSILSLELEKVFCNCVIAKGIDDGRTIIIDALSELLELLDHNDLEDCVMEEGESTFPEHPGVYIADIEFWFKQGYDYEGYPSNSESDWDFRIKKLRKLDLDTLVPSKYIKYYYCGKEYEEF
jgi:hypothetical protein